MSFVAMANERSAATQLRCAYMELFGYLRFDYLRFDLACSRLDLKDGLARGDLHGGCFEHVRGR